MSAWMIVWGRNKVIDIGEWSACEGGKLERFYCISVSIYMYIYMYIAIYSSSGVYNACSITQV